MSTNEHNPEPELKPCPFCGSRSIGVHWSNQCPWTRCSNINCILGTNRVSFRPEAWNRRITPLTDTAGSGREGETVPKDHVIDRTAPIETQLAQAEAWIAQLQQSYLSIQQTCAKKDQALSAALAENEGLRDKIYEACSDLERSAEPFDRACAILRGLAPEVILTGEKAEEAARAARGEEG